jgi:predicted Zn-dependent protease
MKKFFEKIKWLLLIPLTVFFFACAKKPVIGTEEFSLISHSQELAIGRQAVQEILKEEKLVKDPKYTERVKKVFKKLVEVLPPKFRNAYDWKVYILNKDEINAFALPNGNIFVYKGLLDFIDNDDELAAVLGHEMSHVILRHIAEKISWSVVADLGERLLLSKVSPSQADLAARLYNLGINIAFLLPYSRRQEEEADIVGVLIAMRAGYNPEGAIKLWEKMIKKFKGKEPPEFLSDHPANEKRLQYIKKVVEFLKTHPQYVKEFKIPKELLES